MARQLRRSTGTVAEPPARKPPPRVAARPDIGRPGRGIGQFIGEVRSELRKVAWPTRQQAAKLTALVVAIAVAVGFILGGIDFVFSELFRALLR
ncbi:MAG: preprotein translocase subunit SecE [Chloroflexi bacterium]|nr:preprotein translocase subunit SecE [Chloroflexota bacterium]